MKGRVRVVLRYFVAIAIGAAVGYFVKSELLVPSSEIDHEWKAQFTEDQGHKRIMDFQDALQAPKEAESVDELSKQLDAQLRIEDLIIKSREAEYAKWLPFTPLFTAGVGAILGLLTGRLGRRPGGSVETPK